MMINAGIKKIVTYGNYPDTGGVKELLDEAGVEFVRIDRPSDKITFLD
jgi:deoxycytidylate deaminase